MRRIISILTILIFSICSVVAQTNYKTVKGYVVDKNGNPIPGAEVTTPGGGESVLTDADGSFSMSVHPLLKKLTATYDGMATKTIKIKPDKDLVFTLKQERKNYAFLNALGGYSCNMNGDYDWDNGKTESYQGPSLGIMAGMLGKWGFYGKVNYAPEYNLSITMGLIKSIYQRKIFTYAGIGYGRANRYYFFGYEYSDSEYYFYYDYEHQSGIAADCGFIFKTGRHFNLTIGYNLISTFPFTGYNWYTDEKTVAIGANYVHGVQLGLGYVF